MDNTIGFPGYVKEELDLDYPDKNTIDGRVFIYISEKHLKSPLHRKIRDEEYGMLKEIKDDKYIISEKNGFNVGFYEGALNWSENKFNRDNYPDLKGLEYCLEIEDWVKNAEYFAIMNDQTTFQEFYNMEQINLILNWLGSKEKDFKEWADNYSCIFYKLLKESEVHHGKWIFYKDLRNKIQQLKPKIEEHKLIEPAIL
ncbi:MAG: hypothetical protein QW041_01160 [Candidatus Pacearchaeota archaeon]